MLPIWPHTPSWIALCLGLIRASVAAADVLRHPQQMWIMDVVRPPTALFGGPFTLWLAFRYGRLVTRARMQTAIARNETPPSKAQIPFAIMVAKGASHCGSGCMIGDIVAEWLPFLVASVAIWFGWTTVFEDKMGAVWVLDFVFAFLLGIAFQSFTIWPMRDLSPGAGPVAALKVDTLSLPSWQIGMDGFMAFAQLCLLGLLLGHRAEVDTPEFWFMMQIAMVAGFITACPVNWWLLRSGFKETR